MVKIKRNKDKSKDITARGALSNNIYVLKLAWGIHPQRVVADFARHALQQFSRVFYSVIFIRFLLEAMEKGSGYADVAIFIGATLVVFFFVDYYEEWYKIRFKPISDTILYEHLYEKLFQKASEVELNCYEDTHFYNTYTTAIKEADIRVSAVIDNVASIIFSILAAVSVFGVMYSIDQYVLIFALFPIIGNFVIGKKLNQLYYSKYMDGVKYERRMDYVNRTLYLNNYAKELRLSNIFSVLKIIYDEGYQGILKLIKQYRARLMFTDFWKNLFAYVLIFEGVLLYGAYLAMVTKTISISEFAVLSTAMVSGAWILIGMSDTFIKLYENGVFINNLNYFLKYESEIKETDEGLIPDQAFQSITFTNVSFAYKGAEQQAMSDINLTIPHKAKITLVGHNGAGKTTFIKMLMRLYDPTGGEIRYNGIPVQDYQVKGYREKFGATFQDFQIFAMTIGENVLMRELETPDDRWRVEQALRKSGVYDKVMSLPNGIDTVLTREFDNEGVVLSGGELQKIAIARVFVKDSEIVIMDEPTSALDPIAEYQLYESIMKECEEKTVIFISHRLSSAVVADRIYLFEEGRIVEEGSHTELMQLNGKYAEMFRKQAEKYIESDTAYNSYLDRPGNEVIV